MGAFLIGAFKIYHACVQNFVHEKSDDILRSLYKSAVFVIQALRFYETGKYIKSKAELQKAINPLSVVLDTALALKNGACVKFEEMSELLLNWTKMVIAGYKE